MNARAFLLLAVVFSMLAVSPAGADAVEGLGVFGDWRAYRTTQAGKKLCFMASEPKKDEGKYTKRGKIYAIVSHRPSTKALNVVSIRAGYTHKEGSVVSVDIGGKAFTLFTDGDTAWMENEKDDTALVKAMKAGRTMVVRGVSSRGTKTKDTYSLLGSTAAHKAISKACGLR